LNPLQAAQFRRSQGKRAKTDRLDAQALARFVAVRAPAPQPVWSEALMSLRELTRFRADMVQQRTTILHRLIGTVDLAFPELPHLLRDLRGPTSLKLLAGYPTAASVAEADPTVLQDLLHRASRGHFGPGRVAELIQTAKTSIASRLAAGALALKVGSLVHQVTALDQEIASLNKVTTLATLIAEAGPIARYPTAKQFVAHFGWCPVAIQSGAYKDSHPRLSQAGSRFVRRIVWMLAIHVISRPGPYQDYFARRTAAGKHKMDSVVAVGRKLLSTIYAILKTGLPYDPAYHTQSARHLPAA
jgi:transposase